MLDLSFYNGKRVLVTGHTGFKGSYLTKILLMAGAKVLGYSLEPETTPSLFDQLKLSEEENLCHVIGDVRDLAHLKEAFDSFKPELVFHLAAQPIVRTSYEKPVYTYETNVIGTVNLLECCRTTEGVKAVLNVTTDKVYENLEENRPYRETDRLDGYDPYSNSKSCSELVTHSYKKSFLDEMDVRVSTARAGNVIGGGDYSRDRIIPDAVRAAEKHEPLNVRNPYSTRPFQHVLEPLYAYLMIVEKSYKEPEFTGYYNVGPDEVDCLTTGHIADLFCEAWGEGMRWENKFSGGPHEAGFLRLDNEKLKKTFGWTPKWNVKEAVEKTVVWSKAEDKIEITKAQISEFFGM